MKLRVGWGRKISVQFAVVVLPLAALLFIQAWMDLRRSSQLSDAFPSHLSANSARKTYKLFVDGVADAVDSGKLPAQALSALHKTAEPLNEIAQRPDTADAAKVLSDLNELSGQLGSNVTLDRLMPMRTAINGINDALQRLDEQYQAQTLSVVSEAQIGARRQLVTVGIIASLVLMLTVYFVRTMISRLTKPLNDSIRIAKAIAVGDLSAGRRVEGQDETTQLLNALSTMTDWLRDIVGQVRSSSDGIQASSTSIASSNRDLSERTENAAKSLRRTAASVEQINTTIRQNAGNASQANQVAAAATAVARKGGEVIGQVVATMGEIESSSKKISDITGVIDSIAFQTNILALNAAVEAARAGEHGRGFAVVASEVRGLALRSADAAREIKSLIHESVGRVQSGSSLVVNAGQTMEEIVVQVRCLSGLIAEINAASTSQAREIGQLHGSVGDLDQMTQQNAAMVEQSAAASASMTTLAVSLAQAVSRFHLTKQAVATS